MNYEVKYKVNQNKFRTVIKFDDIKICEYLNGTSIHPVVQVLISKIVKIFKSGLHPCPYEVSVKHFDNFVLISFFFAGHRIILTLGFD